MKRNFTRRSNTSINPARTKAKRLQAKNDYTHTVAKSVVKREMSKQLETKFWEGILFNSTPVPDEGVEISAIGFNVNLLATYPIGPVAFPTQIAQGDGVHGYIGNRISPKYLVIHYALDYLPSGDTTNIVSIMVMQAKGNFLFDSVSAVNQYSQSTTIISPLSFPNNDFNDRFRVLARRILNLNSDNITNRTGTITIKLNRLTNVHFKESDGTIEAGTLNMSLISDSVSEDHPSIRAVWRVYYKDA